MHIRILTGMPVIFTETGKKIGRVVRVHTDQTLSAIEGMWVTGRLGKMWFCPRGDVNFVGENAVFVKSSRGCRAGGEAFGIRRALDEAGMLAGAAVGAYFDPQTLEIQALEISYGFWEDIARGHSRVRTYTVRLPQGDVMVTEEGKKHEGGNDSGHDRGKRDRRVGGNAVRNDELANRTQTGPRRGQRGKGHIRKGTDVV